VPLKSERERPAGELDALDDAVAGDRAHPKPAAEAPGGLMVLARHVGAAAEQRAGEAATGGVDPMDVRPVRLAGGAVARQVLEQAAAEGDVEQLVAAADADDRQVEAQRGLHHPQLAQVLAEVRIVELGAPGLAIERGVQVGEAAADQHAVGAGEVALALGLVARAPARRADLRAGVLEPALVELEVAARLEQDHRPPALPRSA
jgi:hypothetical protein